MGCLQTLPGLLTLSVSDAQVLVAGMLTVNVAAVATVLLFFQQATSRFGHRAGVAVLKLRWVVGLGLALVALTGLVLLMWAYAVKGNHNRDVAPLIVGASILIAGAIAAVMARAVLTDQLIEIWASRLRREDFPWHADEKDDLGLQAQPEALRDLAATLLRAGDLGGIRRLRKGLRDATGGWVSGPDLKQRERWEKQRLHLPGDTYIEMDDLPAHLSAVSEILVEAATQSVTTQRYDQPAIELLGTVRELEGRAHELSGAESWHSVPSGLMVLGRLALDERRGDLFVAIVDTYEQVGEAGALDQAGEALRELVRVAAAQAPIGDARHDHEPGAPKDPFRYALWKLEELGGHPVTKEKAASRQLHMEVAAGAMPGARSEDEVRGLFLSYSKIIEECIENDAITSLPRAMHNLSACLWDNGVAELFDDGMWEAYAEDLAFAGAASIDDDTTRYGVVSDKRWPNTTAAHVASVLARFPAAAVEKGLREASIKSEGDRGARVEGFIRVMQDGLDSMLGFGIQMPLYEPDEQTGDDD